MPGTVLSLHSPPSLTLLPAKVIVLNQFIMCWKGVQNKQPRIFQGVQYHKANVHNVIWETYT
jgi:hypothetical protein